ncbi:MAG: nuclear transport factor 2 family protein [Novosphingobium sp.]|nr:nuclear transport factor 2 family protein [Novosphingobium sp.]
MDRNARLEWAADVIEIQQLAYRYSISADSKDPETMASLFIAHAELGDYTLDYDQRVERFANAFKSSPVCILNVGNHLIDIDPDNSDRATGTVYSRCEAEWNEKWLIQQIVYFDEYHRENGKWLFAKRRHLLFYGAELGQNPMDLPRSDAMELTDGKGSMPQIWPTYSKFFKRFPEAKHF